MDSSVEVPVIEKRKSKDRKKEREREGEASETPVAVEVPAARKIRGEEVLSALLYFAFGNIGYAVLYALRALVAYYTYAAAMRRSCSYYLHESEDCLVSWTPLPMLATIALYAELAAMALDAFASSATIETVWDVKQREMLRIFRGVRISLLVMLVAVTLGVGWINADTWYMLCYFFASLMTVFYLAHAGYLCVQAPALRTMADTIGARLAAFCRVCKQLWDGLGVYF
jgi:hypothetical protein